jgi:hypothetical protein
VRRGGDAGQQRCAKNDKGVSEQLDAEKRAVRQALVEEHDAGCDRDRIGHEGRGTSGHEGSASLKAVLQRE